MATANGAPPIYADVFRFGRQRVAWINYRHAVARRRKFLENVEIGMQIIGMLIARPLYCVSNGRDLPDNPSYRLLPNSPGGKESR